MELGEGGLGYAPLRSIGSEHGGVEETDGQRSTRQQKEQTRDELDKKECMKMLDDRILDLVMQTQN